AHRPARDEQKMAAPRVDLERPAERSEQIDSIARTQPGEPVGAPTDDPEMDGHRAGRRIARVEREGAAKDRPGEAPGTEVDERAGARAGRDGRGVIRLEPLARQ